MGEAEVGGIAMNIIPRTGGNTFTGHLFATGFNDATQASNYTERIRTIGLAPGNPFTLAPPNSVNYNYETTFSSGGPIIRDRMWFFGLLSYRGNGSDVSMFHNKNAGDITKWLYEADLTRQAKSDSRGPIQPNLRLTIQVSQRNKLNLFWDEQISSDSIGQGNSTKRAGDRCLESWLAARTASEVDVHGDEQASARGRTGHLPLQLEQP
jgi:hypothetical protein